MKGKTKRIVAGLGLGAMLGSGAILATGCTDMNLTQDQTDKILQTIENADDFMNEGKKYFNKEEKIDKETIVGMYNYAIGTLLLNKEDVWNNLIVEMYENSQNLRNLHFFKKADGVKVLYTLENEIVDGVATSNVVSYRDSAQEIGYIPTGDTIPSFEYDCNTVLLTQCGICHDLTTSEIVDYNLSETGGLFVTAFTKNLFGVDGEKSIINFELLANGSLKFISYDFIHKAPLPNCETLDFRDYKNLCYEIRYEYGKLTESQVQANIDKYNASQNSSSD